MVVIIQQICAFIVVKVQVIQISDGSKRGDDFSFVEKTQHRKKCSFWIVIGQAIFSDLDYFVKFGTCWV